MPTLPKKQPRRAYIPKQKRKPSSNQAFYNSTRWRKVRAIYRKSVNYLCEANKYIGIDFTEPRMPVDHIIPIEHGGDPFDFRNLNLLSISYHERKSGMEGHEKGPLVEAEKNERGYLIPVRKEDIWKLLTK